MIERKSYLKLLERVKAKELDEKMHLKVLFVRDHF
jgi:hypothetical protein